MTTDPQPTRAFVDATLAVHPDDGQVIAVAAGEAYTSRCALYVSLDGGMSWLARTSPQPEGYQQCVYSQMGPVGDLAFSPDGEVLYYAFAARKFPDWRMQVFLSRSRDLGRTWQTARVTNGAPDLKAKDVASHALPSVAVDPVHPQRVYVAWQSNYNLWYHEGSLGAGEKWYPDYPMRPLLAVSHDGGNTFADPVDMATGAAGRWLTAPHLLVDGSDTLFAFFGEYTQHPEGQGEDREHPEVHLFMAGTTDGGRTFRTRSIFTRPAAPSLGWLSDPAPAVDPKSGALYVVWEDMAESSSQGVLFARSDDRGGSWTDPVRVSDYRPKWNTGWNAFMPWMSVAPNGRIDVAWYDFRNDPNADGEEFPGTGMQDVYYSFSRDGGRTWEDDVRITDRVIDRRFGVWQGSTGYGVRGPIGIASSDDGVFLAWDDSRNAVADTEAQDIYFTRAWWGTSPTTATPTATAKILWSLLGAGAAFAVSGVALLIGSRWLRRRQPEVGSVRSVVQAASGR